MIPFFSAELTYNSLVYFYWGTHISFYNEGELKKLPLGHLYIQWAFFLAHSFLPGGGVVERRNKQRTPFCQWATVMWGCQPLLCPLILSPRDVQHRPWSPRESPPWRLFSSYLYVFDLLTILFTTKGICACCKNSNNTELSPMKRGQSLA